MSIVNSVVSNVVTPVVTSVSSLNPILHMPLINGVNILAGVGSATFTRALEASYVDRIDGVTKTAAINIARFEAEGYLVEAARTNLQTYSEATDNAAWTKSELTVSADNAVSPDGNTTMDLMIPSANDAAHTYVQLVSVTSGTTYTQYVYAKSGGYDFIQITGSTGFAAEWVNFDLTDGTIGDSSLSTGTAVIKDFGGGIYRCTLTLPATSTTTGGMLFGAYNTDVATRLPTFAGDASSGVNVWGNQFEAGKSPSSYIKTTTVAVTRPADTLSVDDENIPAPGLDYSVSMDVTLRLPRPSGTTTFCMKINGEATRRIYINSTSTAVYQHTDSLTTAALPTTTFNITVTKNASLMAVYIDGVLDSSQAPGTVTGTKNNIHIGRDGVVAARYLNGHIKNLRIFDKALTASEVLVI